MGGAMNRPPCQRGLAAGKARRLGDCPPVDCRSRKSAQAGELPKKQQPFPEVAFQVKSNSSATPLI